MKLDWKTILWKTLGYLVTLIVGAAGGAAGAEAFL